IVDPAAERLLAEMAKKTGKDAAELLTAALTAHAQAIGVLPARSPPPMTSEERFRGMMEIADRAAQRPVFDPRRPDDIIAYNVLGLPE
ncbi:MAG: type II toxin-antitoxin system VapB family antitoxin, partial [Acetobacteraceae bacterium]|nr:type II toxin-antitoxin system VapB family antitoxin [Acetobacteraceae bacterium]